MEYRNAKYIFNGWIDCEINHPQYGWIPFTCDPDDKGARFDTRELFDRMVTEGNIAPYIPPTQEELDTAQSTRVRRERDNKLRYEVDPIISNPLRWAELTEEKKQEIANYRLALLAIPDQQGFPWNVEWPVSPLV